MKCPGQGIRHIHSRAAATTTISRTSRRPKQTLCPHHTLTRIPSACPPPSHCLLPVFMKGAPPGSVPLCPQGPSQLWRVPGVLPGDRMFVVCPSLRPRSRGCPPLGVVSRCARLDAQTPARSLRSVPGAFAGSRLLGRGLPACAPLLLEPEPEPEVSATAALTVCLESHRLPGTCRAATPEGAHRRGLGGGIPGVKGGAGPAGVAQPWSVGLEPRGHRSASQSGRHGPGMWAPSPAGVCRRQLIVMFLSH